MPNIISKSVLWCSLAVNKLLSSTALMLYAVLVELCARKYLIIQILHKSSYDGSCSNAYTNNWLTPQSQKLIATIKCSISDARTSKFLLCTFKVCYCGVSQLLFFAIMSHNIDIYGFI